jgi:hypothetical protein
MFVTFKRRIRHCDAREKRHKNVDQKANVHDKVGNLLEVVIIFNECQTEWNHDRYENENDHNEKVPPNFVLVVLHNDAPGRLFSFGTFSVKT